LAQSGSQVLAILKNDLHHPRFVRWCLDEVEKPVWPDSDHCASSRDFFSPLEKQQLLYTCCEQAIMLIENFSPALRVPQFRVSGRRACGENDSALRATHLGEIDATLFRRWNLVSAAWARCGE
jgi:hypothetical protein